MHSRNVDFSFSDLIVQEAKLERDWNRYWVTQPRDSSIEGRTGELFYAAVFKGG